MHVWHPVVSMHQQSEERPFNSFTRRAGLSHAARKLNKSLHPASSKLLRDSWTEGPAGAISASKQAMPNAFIGSVGRRIGRNILLRSLGRRWEIQTFQKLSVWFHRLLPPPTQKKHPDHLFCGQVYVSAQKPTMDANLPLGYEHV